MAGSWGSFDQLGIMDHLQSGEEIEEEA